MPRLLLLRHAKAERASAGMVDQDRRLAERGRADAATVGTTIADRGEQTSRVLCSTSLRTRETYEIIAPALREPVDVHFLPELYDSGDYLTVLRKQGGDAGSLLLIGHNPTMHETARRLAAPVPGEDGAALEQHFPTAALAILDFDMPWDQLQTGAGRLLAFIRPHGAPGN